MAPSGGSLDSSINSMTASLVTDWLRGREVGPTVNRLLTGVFGASAITIACLLQTIDMPIFSILMSISGASLGVLLAVLILGMTIERANTTGAYVVFLFGLGGFALARFLNVQNWWDGAFVSLFGFLGGFAMMYLAKPPSEKQLKGLMIRGSYKP